MHYLILALLVLLSLITSTASGKDVATHFEHEQQTQMLMDIEAAMARAQADNGVIPQWAAREIQTKANASLITEQALREEFLVVRHRMVAFLNVWGRQMEKGAEQYLHFGATNETLVDSGCMKYISHNRRF